MHENELPKGWCVLHMSKAFCLCHQLSREVNLHYSVCLQAKCGNSGQPEMNAGISDKRSSLMEGRGA